MKKLILPAIISLFAGILFGGCRHKDIEFDSVLTGDVRVVFDWRNAPDAAPESMAAYFFDTESGRPMRFIFQNRTGDRVELPAGSYSALGMNSDNTDWARFSGTDDEENFIITTADAETSAAYSLSLRFLPRSEEAAGERVAQTPGMVWSDRQDNINVEYGQGEQTVTFYPQEVVCHYTVDILDVQNLEYVDRSEIDGTLSGMAEGYNHGACKATDTHVTMPFTLSANTEASTLHGEFLTFGECSSEGGKHVLTIYLYLKDGSKWYYTFDVTRQVSTAPDPRHVHIQVSGLPLPRPIMAGGGIRPDVTDWQTEEIEIRM